jgi:hypothetical protein
MGNSKERRREQRRRQREKLRTQVNTQQERLEPLSKSHSRRLLETQPFLVLGFLGTLVALIYGCHDAFKSPEISAISESDPLNPLAFPFAIKNRSAFFDMKNTRMSCGNEDLMFAGHNHLWGNDPFTENRTTTIAAEDTVNFRCFLLGPDQRNRFNFIGIPLEEGKIEVWLHYETLGFNRASAHKIFTWYAAGKPPRWIDGPVVNN